MQLEPSLAVVGPGGLDTVVIGDGSKVGEVGRRKVLEDGVGWANTVGGGVGDRGKGRLLIFEDKIAKGFRGELDDDRAR